MKSSIADAFETTLEEERYFARKELAACYRLVAHFGMTDTIYNHISLRVPGYHDRFYINAFGLMYEEITASNLVTVDLEGSIVDDPTGLGINPAGFVIHGAIHGARHDVACVLHTHSIAGVGVSAQEHGLLPISQHAALFHGLLSYHDSEGIAVDSDECARLVEDLGDKPAMILRNHGLLTAGRTVGEALQLMINLDTACRAQIAALAGGAPVIRLSDKALESTADTVARLADYDKDWAALLRLADRVSPGYAD
ncbi:MAG TPA: class II aldolase/adducin family protein [Novosphingobium sp.]|nr:class II aldolase/adducin family protein [Novosphingobium sp.]